MSIIYINRNRKSIKINFLQMGFIVSFRNNIYRRCIPQMLLKYSSGVHVLILYLPIWTYTRGKNHQRFLTPNMSEIKWDTRPSFIKDILLLSNRKIRKASNTYENFGYILIHVFQRIGQKDISLFAEIERSMWDRRDKLMFERSLLHLFVLFSQATQAHDDFQEAN